MPEAMVTLGKKKKLPFLILSGILIAFFGVPLGLGGLSAAVGLIISVLALIVSFYIVAFSLILAGWLSALVMIIRIFSPGFLDPWIDIYPLVPDPTFNAVIYIVGALLIAALGLGLLAGLAHDEGCPVCLPAPVRQGQELAEACAAPVQQ